MKNQEDHQPQAIEISLQEAAASAEGRGGMKKLGDEWKSAEIQFGKDLARVREIGKEYGHDEPPLILKGANGETLTPEERIPLLVALFAALPQALERVQRFHRVHPPAPRRNVAPKKQEMDVMEIDMLRQLANALRVPGGRAEPTATKPAEVIQVSQKVVVTESPVTNGKVDAPSAPEKQKKVKKSPQLETLAPPATLDTYIDAQIDTIESQANADTLAGIIGKKDLREYLTAGTQNLDPRLAKVTVGTRAALVNRKIREYQRTLR